VLTGSSLYNKPRQGLQPHESDELSGGTQDVAAELQAAAEENYRTEMVLREENEENEEYDAEEEETEPEVLVHPTEVEEDDEDERVITEEDLYDPSEHTAPDVNDYLDSDISEDERARVIAAERQGKNRKGIVNRG
jgi:hypothetical protein